jgi:phospholipid/cholesterol/gamma-HCH transport system ATP-binding protein
MDQLILQLARTLKITFIIVTHELPSIYTIADRCIMLSSEEKTIIAQGNPHDLRDHCDNPWVRQFFKRQAQENKNGSKLS